eukprot:2702922-Pyramimonas_sp.AAC.1
MVGRIFCRFNLGKLRMEPDVRGPRRAPQQTDQEEGPPEAFMRELPVEDPKVMCGQVFHSRGALRAHQ